MDPSKPARHEGKIARIVRELGLVPHPEGGFYRETYRSPALVQTPRGERAALTAIHFLLPGGATSVFHRVLSDEAWIHGRGGALALHVISPEGSHRIVSLGPGEHAVVPAGHWQAARPVGSTHALVTCIVAPGFEPEDFEITPRAQLARACPGLDEAVLALARP